MEWADKPTQTQVLYFNIKKLFETHVREKLLPQIRTYDEELLRQYAQAHYLMFISS